MAATVVLSGLLSNTTSDSDDEDTHEVPLDSIPLYNIANFLFNIISPIIILLGALGNTMVIVIMYRLVSEESAINYYFIGMAVSDLFDLIFATFNEWLTICFHLELLNASRFSCKMIIWFQTAAGTISCWYLVCLTLHRAMSVVWPHRVGLMCTPHRVLGLVLGIALSFAAVYAHYLFGLDLNLTSDGMSYECSMDSEDYIRFVFEVFVYLELVVYSLLPFGILVCGNGVLIWKLSASIKEARNQLSHGNTEQISQREKTANSVTLTVIVVSVTFICLTCPISVNYILSFFVREYNLVRGYEYAKVHMFYIVARLLANANSAVNFYLYCLTGTKFRHEFFKTICCRGN